MGVLGNACGGAIVVHAPLSTVALMIAPETLVFPFFQKGKCLQLFVLFVLEISFILISKIVGGLTSG